MQKFAYFASFLSILAGNFLFVSSYSSIHVDIDPIIRLGVLVDFESDIMKGIRNDSLSQLMDNMRVKLNSNFTSEATMMTNYKDFELQVEDNPFFCDKYLAVISVISCSATQSLYDLMREFCPSTLLLSIHDRKCERPSKDQGIGFPILSSVHDIVPMLTDMRNDFLRKWNQINLIHDHSLDIDSLHDLVHSLTTVKTSHTEPTKITTFHFESKGYLLQIASKIMHNQPNTSLASSQSESSETEDDINTKIAHKLRSSDHLITVNEVLDNTEKDKNQKNFLVIAQSHMILELVESANSRGMLKYPYQWLLVLSDVQHDPNYWKRIGPILASTQVAIVTRELSLYGQCHELEEGCQIRLAMETFHQSLEKVAQLGEYDFSETSKRGQIKNRLLAEMRLTLGNQEATSQYCGNCNRYVVQTFQRITSGNHIGDIVRREPSLDQTWTESTIDTDHVKVTNTGEWTPFKGLLQEEDMDSEKPSIAGRKIRVGIINQPPYVNVKVEGEKCLVNGTTIELFKLLSSRMNFTVEWVCWQHLEHIGTMMPNGSFDGLLAKIASGEIEIAANGIWKTPSRVKSGLYEFFFPYDVDVVGLVVKKTPEDNEWLFLTPFTVDTWVCVIACMVLIGPIVWIVHRSAKYYDFYGCRDREGLFKLSECIWYTYGAMVQQGGDTLPAAISGRVLIGGWWIFVIVTVTTYSGNLVALLTFPKIVQPIENAQDLYDTWGVSWGTPAPNELSETVQIARFGGLDILRDGMEYYYDFEKEKYKLFDDVAADRLALILKRHEARRWVSVEYLRTGFCGMHIAKDALYHTPIHLVAKKGVFSDPLIEEFNRNIMIIARAGIMVYWRKWFETPGDDCLHPSLIHAGEVKKVDVVHMIGAYIILAWGIGIGCVSLIGELIYFAMKNRDKTVKMNPLEMIRDAFIRLKSNPPYHKWADGRTAVIDSNAKSMKMPFVPPGMKTEPSYVTEYGMSGVTGKGFRPRVNQSYQDQIRSIYDDPANFHYFSYAPLRPSYKPKFR